MYEERESDRKRGEKGSPTQPNGRPTSGADKSGRERGLTRANGMSPYKYMNLTSRLYIL